MTVCPDGYTYLGDDLPPPADSKSWVYEEVDRTDVYRSEIKDAYSKRLPNLAALHLWLRESRL